MKKLTALLLIIAVLSGVALANLGQRRIYPHVEPKYRLTASRDPNNWWDDVNDVYTLNGLLDVLDVNITGDLDVNDVNVSGDLVLALTEGSVLFVGPGGLVSQDNTNLFWDDINNRLGLRTASPLAAVTLTRADGAWTGIDDPESIFITGTANTNLRLTLSLDTVSKVAYISAAESTVGWNDLVLQQGGGQVGIGTSPDSMLHIAGATHISGSGGLTIDSTVAIGLDMSGGTFATAIQKWPAGTIQTTGTTIFQTLADSTTAYQWLDQDGGTPILNIDTTNERVGIGTDSPEADFHIINSGGEAQLLLQSLATSDATIRIRNGSSSKWTFGNDASNDEFIISTGSILGTPKLTILQGGKVGIGTGATAPNAPLEVKGAKPAGNVGGFQSGMFHITGSGTAEFSNSVITGHSAYNTNTQLWYLGSTSSGNNDIAFINRQNAAMHFYTNNTPRMTIDAAGDATFTGSVTAPNAVLNGTTAIGLDFTGTFATAIQKWPAGTISTTGTTIFQPAADSTTAYQWLAAAGGTPIVNIDSTNKRVGFNVVDPDAPVEIDSTDAVLLHLHELDSGGGVIKITNTTDAAGWFFGTQGLEKFGISRDAGMTGMEFIMLQTGLLGLGTDLPLARLHLARASGQLLIEDTDSGDSWGYGTHGNVNLAFYEGAFADVRVFFKAGGNIGYGGELDPATLAEWTSTVPYLTLHNSTHEDSDGGRESRLIFKGEQSGGEESELAVLEVSHDGAADDQLGKMVLGVNTGAGVVDALTIDSAARVIAELGVFSMSETTTPTAIANNGAIYTKSTNTLWFQDGAGVEHLLHGDSFSNIWYHGSSTVEVTISTQNAFAIIDSFTVVGHSDDLLNAVGSSANNNITLSALGVGEYEISYHSSATATGGADKEMIFALGITLATPKDITNVTDDTVTPIVITSVAHGLENGDMVEIVGVVGNTAANGSFIVDSKADDTFQIVDLAGGATTGNGDYNEGSPTGDVTILYPGNMVVHRMVRGADLGALSATGIHILAASDVLAIYVANVSGTTNLTVAAFSFDLTRIGD